MAKNGEGKSGNADKIPDNLEYMLENIPIRIPEGVSDEMRQVAERGVERRCMACTRPLGANTVLVIKADGIILTYCGGVCMTDHAVIGWIEEQYQDIADRVQFRSGTGDEPQA